MTKNVAKKKKVQRVFRQKTGLRIDQPKSEGYGNSNTGNVARRVFANYKLSAKILGLNEEFVRRCSVILRLLASSKNINTPAFKTYCRQTATLYFSLYPWYYMPIVAHKVLFHGSKFIEHAPLPLGVLTEEPLEARHKDTKRLRRDRARKFSRIATNEEIFNALTVSSDPYISMLREKYLPRADFPTDAQQLLL